jgi:putative ABC transport system ATP-binding protein
LSPIIECQNISRIYKKNLQVAALQGISFTVHPGEFVSIVGRSGSGKSTLLNLIGGLDVPDTGVIRVHGQELNAMSSTTLAQHRRHMVGMIFQSFNLIPSRTALENVELALLFGGIPKSDRPVKAGKILEFLGLKDRLHHKPSELSGGEQQRVAIARAMANNPHILLADEPTGNLDSKTAASILELLSQLNENDGKTILMVTHDAAAAAKISHRVIQLLDGQIADDSSRGGRDEGR